MSAFPTLGNGPDYPLDPDGEMEDSLLRSDVGAGYQQTRPKFTRTRLKFGVSYTLSAADVATLRTFERTTIHNGADSFTWTHPITSTSYTVRLVAPIKYALANFNQTNVSLTLQEV